MPTLNLNYNIIEVQRRKSVGPYPIQMEYLIVGGGGGSWLKTGNDTVGGGGAGGYITGSYCFSPNETQTFTIGAGGNGANGVNTNAFGLTAIGGGRAGANINGAATNANSGGSGGGGADGANPANGTTNQGFGGGSSTGTNGAGGGGGASEAGQDGQSLGNGGKGGDGKQWLDGNYYAGGGGGSNYKASSANTGINGLGSAVGGGAQAGTLAGTAGIVALRYMTGEKVVVTNGSTVVDGNYTYHYFTSGTGSIQFIGDEQQDPNINPCA